MWNLDLWFVRLIMQKNISKKVIKRIFQKIFATYAIIVFISIFLLLCPFFYIFIWFKSSENIVHWIYRIWGYSVMFFCLLRYKINKNNKVLANKKYIYCANHTSYLDIPTMYCAVYTNLSFIGKSSLGKVPLFGYLYKTMHILVNRHDGNSKKETIERMKYAIDDNKSLIIFPEGTIPRAGSPEMLPFKDGAFRIAIEKQIPIVPVSIPNNYRILPDTDKFNVALKRCTVYMHEPIETIGLTMSDLNLLKDKVFEQIKSKI